MIIAKSNETKKFFDKNIELLTPWLKESVLKIDEKELFEKIEVTYNDEGYPICKYHQSDKCFNITSERPIEQAQKWDSNFLYEGAGSLFIFGSGFGYPLFEIFEHKSPHTLVVVFEHDLYLFAAMLYYFDLEPIIKSQKVAFLIGDSNYFAKAFEQLFFSIFFISCTYPVVAFTYTAQRNFKTQYLEIYNYVFTQLSLMVFYIGNDHQDNLIGFCNMISNIPEILCEPYISCLKDKYKDIPSFIIANGPSLDKNIHQLEKINGKGLILSVESAVLPLLKNNIKPDVLAVIERTKNTYLYHFKNKEYPDDIALLSLALVDKRVYPSFSGAKIPILREKEVINNWINEYLGDGSAIDAGANVSHLAVELATYMGANPIVLVGQDYAYGPEQNTHSKDSIYSQDEGKQFEDIIKSRPIVYVEGNNGKMIASNQLWIDFKMGLELKINDHKDKLFINATEGGAKIEGTICENLEDVINKYCTTKIPYRVNEIIAQNKEMVSIPERKENLKDFIKSLEKYSVLFRNLTQQTILGKLECKKMLELAKKDNSEKHRDILEKAYQNNINIINSCLSNGLYRCFTQQVVFANYYQINRCGIINTYKKIIEIFEIQYEFFCQINIVTQSVSVHLENAAESLINELDNL